MQAVQSGLGYADLPSPPETTMTDSAVEAQPGRRVSTDEVESGPGPSTLSLWELFSFAVAHAGGAFLLRLLGLRGLYRFGRCFGALEWLTNYRRRSRFAAAVARILGPTFTVADRRRLTREHFMQSRCDKLLYLLFDCIPKDRAKGLLTVTNVELLEASLQLGRGVYLAMSHHGPLHVGAMLFCVQGYKTVGVRDRNEGAIRRYVQRRFDLRYPEFRRMRVLFADHFPREIYRCFQEGYVVASAMDVSRVRDPSQRMVEVEAFGERRSFLSGPLHVAYRCKATVLQAFVVPEREFRYRVEITQRLMDPNTEEAEDVDVPRAMHVYAANVESFVRRHPALLTRF